MNSVRSPVTVRVAGKEIDERHAVRERVAKRVRRGDGARRRLAIGDDVRLGPGAVVPEHPIHVERDGQMPVAAGGIAQGRA